MKLFKYLPAFLAAATMMAGFSSCDQDLDVPPVILPEGGIGGDGTADAPLTPAGVMAYYNTYYSEMTDPTTYYWATGYIVGCVVTTETVFVANDKTSVFEAPFSIASNILLAATPDETDYNNCISVQLPSGTARSNLNLMDNPGNKGRQVTLHGYIRKYLGLPGMYAVDNFAWGAAGVPGADPTVFTKATSITAGKAYALVANDGSAYQAAKPISESNNYGYLYNATVTVNNDSFKGEDANAFTFTEAPGGYYYINDFYGRYLYMEGTYTSFQVSATLNENNQNYLWLVTPNDDSTWTITNAGTTKVVQYYIEKTSFGAYNTIESGYVLPMLFEKDGEGRLPGQDGGGDMPDAPEGTITVAQALELMQGGFEGEATVAGMISKIDDVSTDYGNATYYIKDSATATQELEVYRGYYIDGAKFTSADQIKVGDQVVVSGKLVNYNGTYEFTSGSKIVSLNGQGGSTDTPTTPTDGTIYSSLDPSGSAMPADWTIENVTLRDALEYVWSFANRYGAKASAYVNNSNHAAESWLLSPSISLNGYASASATFEHAANFLNGTPFANLLGVYVGVAGTDKSTWTDVTPLLSLPDGASWTFVNAGNIPLDNFAGQSIQFGFRYQSTTSVAATWEINTFTVTGKAN